MNNEMIKILLADDDESDRLNFTEAFEELKIKTSVHCVSDGVELMDYLNNQEELPFMLFLDLNMPLKDGLECLTEIRNNERLKNIVVAIYSTSSSEKDIQETFVLGANVYIKKPTTFNALKEALSKVVKAANIYRSPPFNISNFLLRA